ncbi:MAG TPA: O-antigen ligase family protein [Symbiobacteriaceae bacterium]|nr:O-antigen ligase family protein [Symbiobacteriaceae bacterium]
MKSKPIWTVQVIAVILGLAQFGKGLFLDAYLLPVAFLLFLITGASLFAWKRTTADRLNWLDGAVLALGAVYLLAASWGVNQRAALQEGITYLAYVSVYWAISRSIQTEKDRSWYLRAMGVVVAFIAIGTMVLAAGFVPYEDIISVRRLSGPYQYANALAGVMLLGMPLLAGLRQRANQLPVKLLWGASLCATLLVFLLTFSRTAWLLAPVVMLALLALVPRVERSTLLLRVLPSLVAAGAFILPLTDLVRADKPSVWMLVWFAGGLAAAALLELGLHHLEDRVALQRFVPVLFLVIVVGLGGLLVLKGSSVLARITTVSTTDVNWVVRYSTYRDAARAWWTDSPVLGLGGGAWTTVYTQYRSANYVTKVTHSTVVETLVEVGIPGVLLLLSVWAGGLAHAWKARTTLKDQADRVVVMGLAVGLAGLLLHSLLDVDLWFPAISLLVYFALGFMRSTQPTQHAVKGGRHFVVRRVGAGALILVGLLLAPLSTAALLEQQAIQSQVNGHPDAAVAYLYDAVRYDPLNARLRAQLGDLLLEMALDSQSAKAANAAGIQLSAAVKYDPRNASYLLMLTNYYMATKQSEAALKTLEQALVRDPMSAETYYRAVRQAVNNALESIGKGNLSEATAYLGRAHAILEQFDQEVAAQPSNLSARLLLKDDSRIEVFRAFYLALTGETKQAHALATKLSTSKDQAIRREALVLLAALDSSQGRVQEVNRSIAALKKLNTGDDARVEPVRRAIEAMTER